MITPNFYCYGSFWRELSDLFSREVCGGLNYDIANNIVAEALNYFDGRLSFYSYEVQDYIREKYGVSIIDFQSAEIFNNFCTNSSGNLSDATFLNLLKTISSLVYFQSGLINDIKSYGIDLFNFQCSFAEGLVFIGSFLEDIQLKKEYPKMAIELIEKMEKENRTDYYTTWKEIFMNSISDIIDKSHSIFFQRINTFHPENWNPYEIFISLCPILETEKLKEKIRKDLKGKFCSEFIFDTVAEFIPVFKRENYPTEIKELIGMIKKFYSESFFCSPDISYKEIVDMLRDDCLGTDGIDRATVLMYKNLTEEELNEVLNGSV